MCSEPVELELVIVVFFIPVATKAIVLLNPNQKSSFPPHRVPLTKTNLNSPLSASNHDQVHYLRKSFFLHQPHTPSQTWHAIRQIPVT